MKLTSKQKSSVITVAIALALLFLGSLGGNQVVIAPDKNESQIPGAPAKTKEAIVTKVIDGDTMVVTGGERVRLLGIDADEKGYPCYDAARLRLEELVLGKAVVLEPDAEDLDQYGRQLRFVFLGGQNINEQLVAEGLAIALFYQGNQKYRNEITAAEAEALKNKVGCKWEGRTRN